MNCRRVSQLIPYYVSGELPVEQSPAFLAHLKSCPKCAYELESMERAQRALEQPFSRFEPPSVLAAVKNEVCAQQTHRRLSGRWAFAGAAALGLAMCIGLWQARPLPAPSDLAVQKAVTQHTGTSLTRDAVATPEAAPDRTPQPEVYASSKSPQPRAADTTHQPDRSSRKQKPRPAAPGAPPLETQTLADGTRIYYIDSLPPEADLAECAELLPTDGDTIPLAEPMPVTTAGVSPIPRPEALAGVRMASIGRTNRHNAEATAPGGGIRATLSPNHAIYDSP